MIPLFLNALVAISVKLLVPCVGAWQADVDVDLDPTGVPPFGKATLTIGTNVLVGTIDPRGSGKYGPHARVRLVGGGGGWDKKVIPLPFFNDAMVLSNTVIMATASEVGEVAVVPVPVPLGQSYVRPAGSAAQVFGGAPWYVDFTGVTQVLPRVPFPMIPTVHEVLEWDPATKTARIATDDIIRPGMVLVDPRFVTATVRDVEQTFSAGGGASSTCWCGDLPTSLVDQSRLASVLASFARDGSGAAKLKRYQCIVAGQLPDGRLVLVPKSPKSGIPPLAAVTPWYGVPGVSAKVVPGTMCDVAFDDQGNVRAVNFNGLVTEISIAGGIDFAALSAKVDAAFAALVAIFNEHTHVSAGAGSPSAIPVPLQVVPGTVAAVLTRIS
jgi:hypothetical protein